MKKHLKFLMYWESFARSIFSAMAALKMASNAGLRSNRLRVNCAFSTIFALPRRKIYIVQSSHWKTIFSVILISISANALANNGTGGIPRVLEQLELVSNQLSQVQSQLDYQQQQLTELQQETIDCTPERYLNNLCGEGNTPFDLVVSICGNLGGEVAIGGQYALEAKIAYGGGIGWKEVGDGDITLDGGMPIVGVGIFGEPIIIPTEVSVGAGGSIGLGMDTCFEGIKIPIGKNIDRDRVIALLNKLEMGAGQVQATLLDAIDNTYNSQAVATALTAKDTFSSRKFESSDPLAVFSSPEVMELVSLLPAGDRMNALITNPGDMIPEIDPLNLNLCETFAGSPVLGKKMGQLCSFVNGLPNHQLVTGAFQKIEDINIRVIGIPESIRHLICVLFDPLCDPDD